jgi:sporulation protein YlmC with PRC-barrel domain
MKLGPGVALMTLALSSATALLAQTTSPPASASGEPRFIAAQQAGEQLASQTMGLRIKNAAGDDLGFVDDLVLDKDGKLVTVVIGVGGMLGIGEKDVAVPYSALQLTTAADGQRFARLDTTKAALEAAPKYQPVQVTTMKQLEEKAVEWSKKAAEWSRKAAEWGKEKAGEIQEKMKTDGTQPPAPPKQ